MKPLKQVGNFIIRKIFSIFLKKDMKLGIVGQGFVGNAIYQKFKNYYEVKTFDLDSTKCNSTFEDVSICDYVVCVFTDSNECGWFL